MIEKGDIGMIQFEQIITANASAFALLMIVKLHMNTKAVGKGLLDVRILRMMINLTLFQCVFDTLVFWIDGKDFAGARELNYIGNIIYYILNGLIAYGWPLFAEYKISNSYRRVKKAAIVLGIPMVVCTLLILTTPFTGLVFSVNEDNVYARSDIFFAMPMILMIFYVIAGTVNVYKNRNTAGKYMIFPAVYFIIPITIAMLVQIFNYGISLCFIGIAIAITGVYMSTQSESTYIDQMCGVYNRRYYNDYMTAFCNERKNGACLTGILIDMDKFKQINDNMGHHIGDQALIVLCEVLRKQMHNEGFVVRYGGDEFILITKENVESAQKRVNDIQNEIEIINQSKKYEFTLAFSYGIAELKMDADEEQFLREMDKNMYEMKKRRKRGEH